jgi:hypothetical protein
MAKLDIKFTIEKKVFAYPKVGSEYLTAARRMLELAKRAEQMIMNK